MKRNHLLGILLASILTVSFAVTFAPTLAKNKPNESSNLKSYGYDGYTVLQLPSPSTPSHPYNLRLRATHYDARSINGEEDYLSVYVWCAAFPGGSKFVWIGGITDSQAGIDFVIDKYTGYVGAAYHVKVEDGELAICKKFDVITVNLTKAVTFNVSDPWPQHLKDLSFTLPPMTIEFRGIDTSFEEKEAPATLTPPASGAGWTTQTVYYRMPAWVQVSIPAWYGNTVLNVDGKISTRFINTWTPPPES